MSDEFGKLVKRERDERERAVAPTLFAYQRRIKAWLEKVFDEKVWNSVQERGLRLLEEATELAQALGVTRDEAVRLIHYVYNRPVGNVGQEVAGTMVTLAAVAVAAGVDLEAVALVEATRIERPEIIEKVRNRQEEKRAALMTAFPADVESTIPWNESVCHPDAPNPNGLAGHFFVKNEPCEWCGRDPLAIR
jgi:hypothetical protein